MLTFKQWLFERFEDVIINPKSPSDLWNQIRPDTRYEQAVEGYEYIFKALYDDRKGNWYVWWVGQGTHAGIAGRKGVVYDSWSSEYEDVIDFKKPIIPHVYIDIKTRYLEILTGYKWPQKQKDQYLNILKNGKGGKFLSKFKISFQDFHHSGKMKVYM